MKNYYLKNFSIHLNEITNKVEFIDLTIKKVLFTFDPKRVLDFTDSNITTIKKEEYKHKYNLEGLILSNIKTIDDYGFFECYKVRFIVLDSTLECIGLCAFTGLINLKFVIYNGTTYEYSKIIKGAPFENIKVVYCSDGIVDPQI